MDRFVGRAELQESLGLSARGLDAWIAREQVQPYRLSGRAVRFKLSDIEGALARAARRAPLPPSGAAARSS